MHTRVKLIIARIIKTCQRDTLCVITSGALTTYVWRQPYSTEVALNYSNSPLGAADLQGYFVASTYNHSYPNIGSIEKQYQLQYFFCVKSCGTRVLDFLKVGFISFHIRSISVSSDIHGRDKRLVKGRPK